MECKRQTDGRKLDKRSKEVLRIRVVQQICNGAKAEDLAKALDINARTVYRWMEKYHQGGIDALKAKPIPGRPPKLKLTQTQWLANAIKEKTPADFDLSHGLWSVELIRELIQHRFDVHLSDVTVGRLIHSMGVQSQRALETASRRDPYLIDQWRKYEYPVIQRRAKERDAHIVFAEQTGLQSMGGALWGVTQADKSYLTNTLSAVSVKGQCRFMLHASAVTEEVYCEFLMRLAQGLTHQVFLILEQNALHCSHEVSKCFNVLAGKVTPLFLPKSSSELNSTEMDLNEKLNFRVW